MSIYYDDETRKKAMDDEFRAQKGLPTDYDEAVQTEAEKEMERRVDSLAREKFSKDVITATNKMEGPSAKEANRKNAYIPIPESLLEPDDFSD
jgi:hypothetical protein